MEFYKVEKLKPFTFNLGTFRAIATALMLSFPTAAESVEIKKGTSWNGFITVLKEQAEINPKEVATNIMLVLDEEIVNNYPMEEGDEKSVDSIDLKNPLAGSDGVTIYDETEVSIRMGHTHPAETFASNSGNLIGPSLADFYAIQLARTAIEDSKMFASLPNAVSYTAVAVDQFGVWMYSANDQQTDLVREGASVVESVTYRESLKEKAIDTWKVVVKQSLVTLSLDELSKLKSDLLESDIPYTPEQTEEINRMSDRDFIEMLVTHSASEIKVDQHHTPVNLVGTAAFLYQKSEFDLANKMSQAFTPLVSFYHALHSNGFNGQLSDKLRSAFDDEEETDLILTSDVPVLIEQYKSLGFNVSFERHE